MYLGNRPLCLKAKNWDLREHFPLPVGRRGTQYYGIIDPKSDTLTDRICYLEWKESS